MAGGSIVYWKRVGHVEIEDEGGTMRSYGGGDGLDFRFNGEKVGGIYVRFTVGVLGLSANSVNSLVVWNPAQALSRKRKIRVFAGYEQGASVSPIFSGVILEAFPTPPPEMWVNFTCLNLSAGSTDKSIRAVDTDDSAVNDIMGDAAAAAAGLSETAAENATGESGSVPDGVVGHPVSYYNTRVGQIFEHIATELGMSGSRWDAKELSADEKVDHTVAGMKDRLIMDFSDKFVVSVFEENGVLVCDDGRKYLQQTAVAAAEQAVDDASSSSGTDDSSTGGGGSSSASYASNEISVATGLISVSRVTIAGATVRMRLNDQFELFSWVKLKSELVPKANGDYCVIKKKHAGHFRGEPWFTELEMIRRGALV